MGKPEHAVEQYLADQAEANGFRCYKFMPAGKNGVPDRVIIAKKGKKRYTVFVETKAPNGVLRKQQRYRIEEIEEAGGEVRVCYTRQQCDELIQELKSGTFEQNKPCVPHIHTKGRKLNAQNRSTKKS